MLKMKVLLWPLSPNDNDEPSPHCLQWSCSIKHTFVVSNLRSAKELLVTVVWHNLTDTQALKVLFLTDMSQDWCERMLVLAWVYFRNVCIVERI